MSHFDNSDDLLNFNPKASTDEAKKEAYEQLTAIATQDFEGDMDALVDAAVKMYFLQTQGQQDFINRINGDKDSLPTAGAGNITSDSSKSINIDDSTASNWYGKLSADDQNLANSTAFVNALQAQSDAMDGATLSANDLDTVLQNLKNTSNSSTSSLTSFDEAWIDLKNTGLSADELAKKINGLVTASTQLNSMSAQISKMSDLLADKKNGETASASDLAGFDATVRGLDSWEQFEKVMGDSKSSMKDCQAAADALATEWVNNSEFLDNLTEDNKGYYETQLKNMGVENAEQVVEAALAQKKNELAIQQEYETACKEAGITASADLATVTGTEIQALLDEGTISVDTASKLAELVTKKRLANGISLTTSGDIQNLAELAGMTTKVGKLLAEFARIKQLVNTGMIPQAVADTKLEGLQSEIEKQINGGNNTNIGVDISPSGSSTYKAPSSKKSKSSKDSKSTIDWIDRKLSVLQTKIDLTQSKFDNLFNLKSPKNLKKNIDSVTKSLSSAQSKAESFKKKMSGVNLDSSTKKKVQNGTVKLSDYSKTDQKRIKQYQKY